MPQHLDREGCLFIIACGIFPRKLADRLKCAKRQWSQRSLVMKLNNTIASNWKGCAMTLYPKTLPKTEVTTGTTLSSDSSHECIVLHQSLPMYWFQSVEKSCPARTCPTNFRESLLDLPRESTSSHHRNPSEVGGSTRPQTSILVGTCAPEAFFIFSCGFEISMFCFRIESNNLCDRSIADGYDSRISSILPTWKQPWINRNAVPPTSKKQITRNTLKIWINATFLQVFLPPKIWGKQQKYFESPSCRSWHAEIFQGAHSRS